MITPIVPHAGDVDLLWPVIQSLSNEFPACPTLIGDDSHRLTRPGMPRNVEIIKGPQKGFAANANELARRVKTDWLLLLNNDVSLHTGSGKRLRYYIKWAPKKVGLVATSIWRVDGTLDSFGDTFSWQLSRPLKRGRGTTDVVRAGRLPLLSVSGAVMLVRTKAWRELGGLDEGFSQYYEDVDFGWRALAARWRLDTLAGCNSTHLEGQSFPSEKRAYFGARNNLWLIRRHRPKDQAMLRRAERVWRYQASRSSAEVAAAIIRGLSDGLTGALPVAPSSKKATRVLEWERPSLRQEWGLLRAAYRNKAW